jgi:hypothetical protein
MKMKKRLKLKKLKQLKLQVRGHPVHMKLHLLGLSQNKKDWGGKKKTQIPGGKFVQVKKKCQKFPYCNQGDIKALKIFENEKVKKAIQNISKRHNISENVIKTIIAYEYENTFSK